MSLSQILLLIWVFLVSVGYKGWDWSNLGLWIFFIGLAYILVVLLEMAGIIRLNLGFPNRRRSVEG